MNEPLMIAPLLPLRRPACEVCGAAFCPCAYITPDYVIHWYCREHWESRPDEHRDNPT